MTIKIISKKKHYEIRNGMTIRSTVEMVETLSESMIPTDNGELVTDD